MQYRQHPVIISPSTAQDVISNQRRHCHRIACTLNAAHTDVDYHCINNDAKCSHALFTHTSDTFRTSACVQARFIAYLFTFNANVCDKPVSQNYRKSSYRSPRRRDSYRRMFFSRIQTDKQTSLPLNRSRPPAKSTHRQAFCSYGTDPMTLI